MNAQVEVKKEERGYRVLTQSGIFLLSSSILMALVLALDFDVTVERILLERRDGIYPAMLSLEGTLLGFVLAALTIVLGYSQSGRLKLLHRSSHWSSIFHSYTDTLRWTSVATVVALLALLFDRDDSPFSSLAVLCFWAAAFALFFIFRMLWITEKIVKLVILQRPRNPGE